MSLRSLRSLGVGWLMSHNPDQAASGAAVARRHNMRLAMSLFVVYLVMYVAYVLINAFAPQWMEWRPLGGLNLALLSGFGLILVAIVLALIYGSLSRVGAEEGPRS